jgi:hypothetical protein
MTYVGKVGKLIFPELLVLFGSPKSYCVVTVRE